MRNKRKARAVAYREILDRHRAFIAALVICKKSLILVAAAYFVIVIIGILWPSSEAKAADNCLAYRSMVMREAQAVHGPSAPAPMFLAQMRQESSCRPGITAADGGMGISQFMPGTVKQVTGLFPDLGPPEPYSAKWGIRAMIRYDGWIYRRVKGKDECHRWAAVLKGYNAGPGYVQQAQAKSPMPGIWFGLTEFIKTRQSAINFEYSRTYPRKILLKHQKLYVSTGQTLCLPEPT